MPHKTVQIGFSPVLGATFSLFFRSTGALVLIMFVPWFIAAAIRYAYSQYVDPDGVVFPFLLVFLVVTLAHPGTILVLTDAALNGEPKTSAFIHLKAGLRKLVRFWGVYIWLALGCGIAVLLAALFTLVHPGLASLGASLVAFGCSFLTARWCLVFPLIALDDRRIFEAARISRRKIAGRFWMVFALQWLVFLVVLFVIAVPWALLDAFASDWNEWIRWAVSAWLGFVVAIVVLGLLQSLGVALHVALREVSGEPPIRVEGDIPDVGANEYVLGQFTDRMEALAFTRVLDDYDIPYRVRSEPGGDPLFRPTTVLVEPDWRDQSKRMLAEWRGEASCKEPESSD